MTDLENRFDATSSSIDDIENMTQTEEETIQETESYPRLPNSVLININTLHDATTTTNEYTFSQPVPFHHVSQHNQSFKQQQITITSDTKLKIKNELYNINAPVFEFIMQHHKSTFIPRELLFDYVGSFNFSNQTPLMLAAAISNLTFVQQLIPVDVGMLDDFGKSALDYAKEFKASDEVIELLSEYETY